MIRFFKGVGRFFADRPTMTIMISIFVIVFGLVFIAMHFKSKQRPWTCADYANFSREHVPARCFGDFKPNAP